MITLHKRGKYRLVETRRNIKILYLGRRAFAWVEPWSSKEILVVSRHTHITDCILSVGEYCLYDVKNEPHLPGKQFLELEVGEDVWQGYLLLTGLPTNQRKRVRIIATHEVVTGNPAYSDSDNTHVSQSTDKSRGRMYEVTRSI